MTTKSSRLTARRYPRCITWQASREGKSVPQVHYLACSRLTGKYWFPTYTHADDDATFLRGNDDIKMRYMVRYKNYKQYGAKSKIIYEGQEISKDQPQSGTQQPNKTPPPPKQ